MDKTLLDLIAAWWASGDLDAAKVVGDRLHELSSDEIAASLQSLRTALTTGSELADLFRSFGTTMAPALHLLAQALSVRPGQERNFPP